LAKGRHLAPAIRRLDATVLLRVKGVTTSGSVAIDPRLLVVWKLTGRILSGKRVEAETAGKTLAGAE